MIRGTTPTLKFTLPFEVNLLSNLYISICQYQKVVVEKKLEDCIVEDNNLECSLSQEETLRLSSGKNAEIQIRALTTDGKALASNIISVSVDKILKEGVI